MKFWSWLIGGGRIDTSPGVAPVGIPDVATAYRTAGYGPRSRRLAPGAFGPNAALDYAAPALRNQSRDLVRKNALAGSAVDRLVSNVVGTGIKPQCKDQAAQAAWLNWTDESAADGMLDFYGQQAQVFRTVAEAGECFVRFRDRLPQDGLTVPLQLQVIEPELVPFNKNEKLASGNIVRQGIEFDAAVRSKRVAYWMHPFHPGDRTPGMPNNDPVRVPADEVMHIFLPTRPEQIRGEPWLTRAIDRLMDVESYDKAELVRKKTTALFAGFRRRPVPSGAGAGMTVEELQDLYGDDATIEGGVGQASMEPGAIIDLELGEEITFAEPKDVGGQYEVFMRTQHRAIAAAAGILYEQLTGDYSKVNDRTWRAAVTEFRRRVEGWQHHLLVFQFSRPVWRRWGISAKLAGVVSDPFDPRASVKWTPQAWPYINPVQDVQARSDEVKAGFTSRTAVVSERGEDAAVIDEENAADNARADAKGLSYTSDGRTAAKGQASASGAQGGDGEEADEPDTNEQDGEDE